jgi:predicted DNA-binding transcriptional regulator AlpA
MSKTFLRKRAVADRYGVNKRTVDRWAEDGRLPPPIYRGIIPLWDQAELDAQDYAAAAAVRRASKPKPVTDSKSEAPTAA